MRVFKFGGASVKSAEAVVNVAGILKDYGTGNLVIIISAMGKTTNALEAVLNAWWEGGDYMSAINEVRLYHNGIMDGLFPTEEVEVRDIIENYLISLENYFEKHHDRDYDYIYDQVVSYGELLSTRIISDYLNFIGYRNMWLDARSFIITDALFREGRINWESTSELIKRKIPGILGSSPVLTQGFIGSTKNDQTTTLGREGSDYTASIFAHILDAEEVVIWKDVPGILNADPKKFKDAVKFDTLSYQEAIEMTYYGAQVLHPKTIKPIQNKNIPLNVKSFIHPAEAGTIIRADIPIRTDVPIIILKEKQLLVSLSTKDFSFIAEENIKKIFDEVVKDGISVNVMNNSAISFQICIDEMPQKVEKFLETLKDEFFVESYPGLQLLSVKHYRKEIMPDLLSGKEILSEHRSGDTIQFIIRNAS